MIPKNGESAKEETERERVVWFRLLALLVCCCWMGFCVCVLLGWVISRVASYILEVSSFVLTWVGGNVLFNPVVFFLSEWHGSIIGK